MSPQGVRLVGWILGLGLAATVVVAGLGLFLQAGDEGSTDDGATVEPVSIPAMTAPGGEAVPIPADRISVVASSFLDPIDGITYGPTNTIDGDIETAWNSDAPDSGGLGETLTFRFAEPVGLTAIRLVNGYAKGPEIFDANHRIRELEVRTDAGVQRVSLLDTSEEQEIAFEFGTTSKVELEVVEIYEGSGFDDPALTADLALSEIGFVASQG